MLSLEPHPSRRRVTDLSTGSYPMLGEEHRVVDIDWDGWMSHPGPRCDPVSPAPLPLAAGTALLVVSGSWAGRPASRLAGPWVAASQTSLAKEVDRGPARRGWRAVAPRAVVDYAAMYCPAVTVHRTAADVLAAARAAITVAETLLGTP